MKSLKIGYYCELVMADCVLPKFVELLGTVALREGNELKTVEYEVKEAPDFTREKMLADAREEVKDSLVKEVDQFRGWWLKERDKVTRLENDLKEVNEKLGIVSNVFSSGGVPGVPKESAF